MIWTAVAACAASAAAFVTGWMAWETRKLAKSTAADVSAQWRPAIIAKPSDIFIAFPSLYLFACGLENVGAGPAMNVRAILTSPAGKEHYPDSSLGTVAPNAPITAYFSGMGVSETGSDFKVSLHYEDLAGQTYETLCVFGDIDEHPSQLSKPKFHGGVDYLDVTTVRVIRSEISVLAVRLVRQLPSETGAGAS